MTTDQDFFRQQFAKIASEAETQHEPIHMLNMVRFRDVAEYEADQAPEGPAPSGSDAYKTYSAHATPRVEAVGGSMTWMSTESTVVIGSSDDHWDAVFTARYPSRAAFITMITSPEYQAIVHHRTAAVADSKLIMMDVVDL